jgi:hypothetical protein
MPTDTGCCCLAVERGAVSHARAPGRQVAPNGELPPDERAVLVRAAGRGLSARLNAIKARKRRRQDVPLA